MGSQHLCDILLDEPYGFTADRPASPLLSKDNLSLDWGMER